MNSSKTATYVLVGLLLLAAAGLLAGLYSGLLRLGLLQTTGAPAVSPLLHGPLMINGFLGAVFGLIRLDALERMCAYLAPLFMGSAIILLLSGWIVPALWAFLFGSVLLTAIMFFMYNSQPKTYHMIMALCAFSLAFENLLNLL